MKLGEPMLIEVNDPATDSVFGKVLILPFAKTGNTYAAAAINPNPGEPVDIAFVFDITQSLANPDNWIGKKMIYLQKPVTVDSMVASFPKEYNSDIKLGFMTYFSTIVSMLNQYRKALGE